MHCPHLQLSLQHSDRNQGNWTLLSVDFLKTPGNEMDMHKNYWYFGDKPNCRIPFAKDVLLSVNDSPVERNSSSCPTSSISPDVPVQNNPAEETETSDLYLREE
ncbi:transposon Tf2-6 polyprotein [Nephila pilipes]|uniref:Transposon Tf2-6 polyprotein n=1 Tax=Nephila pilipes TaxID=299642 RepID=A0A8X6N2W8_NEPPI|nr:transposon Tf2-6 polyprotein [Nephila pilipes]